MEALEIMLLYNHISTLIQGDNNYGVYVEY